MELLKKLLLFIHPLGFSWLLLTMWLGWRLGKRQWRGLVVPFVAWAVLSLFTCTPLTAWLLLGLEDKYPSIKVADAPTADAIICLGGSAAPSLTEPTRVNFNSNVDRVTSSLGLLAQGKAPVMIVTGGAYKEKGEWYSEADMVVAYLKDTLKLTLPIESIGRCADTHDEAVKIAVMAKERGWNNVLLVTSAAHLPRAVAVFTKAGVKVQPIPCDYISSFKTMGDDSWVHLPQLGSIQGITSWLHEMIGLAVYKWRGWI
ncbi:MAG: YdcF family protein [Verrucomicrobiota bacterium]